MEDLHCLEALDPSRFYQFKFPGLNELKDLSVLQNFHGGTLCVPPQVADQAQELVEQGKAESSETEALLEQILAPYLGQLDAIVLGCTHYPFVKNIVQKILGEHVKVLDGGEGTARQTKRLLEERGWLREGTGTLKMENSSGKQELLDLGMELLTKER